MSRGGNNQILQHATLRERSRLFMANRLGIGNIFTRHVVYADIIDRLHPETADPEISPRAMLELSDKMFNSGNRLENYRLLAQPVNPANSGSGRVWFDVIEGLTNRSVVASVAQATQNLSRNAQPDWRHAVDLGAGTGELTKLLAGTDGYTRVAEQVTAVDRSQELLGVASKRYGRSIEYLNADVMNLPFKSDSCDVLTSGGLVYYLGAEAQDGFFSEVSRVLRPGGVYIDGDQMDHPKPAYNIGRSQLARLILWEACGEEFFGNPLDGVHEPEYFSQFDLSYSRQQYPADAGETPVTVRILTKTQ